MNQYSSQNRLRHLTKRKTSSLKKCVSYYFCVKFATPGLPREPRGSQKVPKITLESLQEAIKNRVHFLTPCLPGNDPQNDLQKWPQIYLKTKLKNGPACLNFFGDPEALPGESLVPVGREVSAVPGNWFLYRLDKRARFART